MFENKPVTISSIPLYEELEFYSLHPDYKKIVTIQVALMILVGLLISVSVLFLIDDTSVWTFFYIPFVVGVIFSVFQLLGFKKKKYLFRQHDVMYQSGVITHTIHIIPLIRLQHVVVKQGWISKKFGLATLALYTAAQDEVDVSIPGITWEEANRWKMYVLNRIQELENASI